MRGARPTWPHYPLHSTHISCSRVPTWRAPWRLVGRLRAGGAQRRLELNLPHEHGAARGHGGQAAGQPAAGRAAPLRRLHAGAGTRGLLRAPQLAILLRHRGHLLRLLRCCVPPAARLLILVRVPPRERRAAAAVRWARGGGDPGLVPRQGGHRRDHAGRRLRRAARGLGSGRRLGPRIPLLAHDQLADLVLQVRLPGRRTLI